MARIGRLWFGFSPLRIPKDIPYNTFWKYIYMLVNYFGLPQI